MKNAKLLTNVTRKELLMLMSIRKNYKRKLRKLKLLLTGRLKTMKNY
jgi:hypothetical protein